MIKVLISGDGFKYQAKPEEQRMLDKIVNDSLEPILLDCIAYNAAVLVKITQNNNYTFEAKCDQYSTLLRMQKLLPEAIPKP